MSKKQNRGRQVVAPDPTNSLKVFYAVIGIIAVIGVILIVGMFSGGSAASENTTSFPTPEIANDGTIVPTVATNEEDAPSVVALEPTIEDLAPETTTNKVPVGTTVDGFYYKGKPDAPVTVVEYSDFQCPACAFHAQNIMPRLTDEYLIPGKVRIIFHDFPLSIHSQARKAAEAARCAGEQGKFWEMHDILFRQQDEWGSASDAVVTHYPVYAEQIGINRTAFETCLTSNKYSTQMDQAYTSSVQVGINETPTFVVDGKKVEIGTLFQEIDAALAAKGIN